MLENADLIMEVDGAQEHEKLHMFVAAFNCLNQIVSGTFGRFLDPLWKTYLDEFAVIYKDLRLSFTLKV